VRLGPPTGPQAAAKPEDFYGGLSVRPARDLDVLLRLDGAAPKATLLSPDGPARELIPTVANGVATYRVPEVRVYAVLVLPGV